MQHYSLLQSCQANWPGIVFLVLIYLVVRYCYGRADYEKEKPKDLHGPHDVYFDYDGDINQKLRKRLTA